MKKMILLLTAALMFIVFAATVNAGAVEDTHSDLNREIKQQTCEIDGKITRTCKICNEVVDITYLWAKYHSEVTEVTVASTCVTAGKFSRYCMLCNTPVDHKPLPLADHTWGAWEVTTKATCQADGEQKHKCTVTACEATEKEPIPKLGGTCDWFNQATDTPATCTEAAYRHSYCKKCGDTRKLAASKPQGALGHAIDGSGLTGTKVPATATTDGYRVLKCSRCDETEKRWEHPLNECGNGTQYPITHDFWKWNHIKTESATCIKDGYTTNECNVCGRVKTDKFVAPGHNLVNKPGAVEVAPTCVESGYWPSVCTVCGVEDKKITLPPKGHTFVTQTDGSIKCSVCNALYVPSK